QELAAEPLRFFRLVTDDPQVDEDGGDHDDEAGDADLMGNRSSGEAVGGIAQQLNDDEQGEDGDASRRDGVILAVTVGVVRIWRLSRRLHADEAHDVGGAVGERVEDVREDADGPARITERDFRGGDRQVEDEHAKENAGDGGVARGDWGTWG